MRVELEEIIDVDGSNVALFGLSIVYHAVSGKCRVSRILVSITKSALYGTCTTAAYSRDGDGGPVLVEHMNCCCSQHYVAGHQLRGQREKTSVHKRTSYYIPPVNFSHVPCDTISPLTSTEYEYDYSSSTCSTHPHPLTMGRPRPRAVEDTTDSYNTCSLIRRQVIQAANDEAHVLLVRQLQSPLLSPIPPRVRRTKASESSESHRSGRCPIAVELSFCTRCIISGVYLSHLISSKFYTKGVS